MNKSIVFLLPALILSAPFISGWRSVPPETDRETLGIVTTDAIRNLVHRGNYYRACHEYESVADGANATLLVRTNAKHHVHPRFIIASEGDAIAKIYESPTITDNGTEITPANFNRQSAKSPDAKIYFGSTVTANGNFLCGQPIYGGDKTKDIGSQLTFTEWVLEEDTTYLIKFTNRAGAAANLFIAAEWYETLAET